MRTWAALVALVATFGVVGCDSDAPKPTQGTPGDGELNKTVLLRGRLVHVGGPFPGTMGPVPKGTVRGRSSGTTGFQVGVDKNGRFELRVPPGRYDIDGSPRYNGVYPCHTESSKLVLVKSREVTVTVYCQYR